MRHALLAVLLVACEAPNVNLVYAISNDGAQACGSTNCAAVEVPCPAVISIRIIDPSDPTAPPVTICEPLPQNRNRDLCAISSVDLGEGPLVLPKKTLEVQMVIWPRSEVETETGDLDCAKHDVMFDAVYGFPISQTPSPAIGGHTFYHPGDEEVRVTLGCTDLDALRTCNISSDIAVTATVENIENLRVLVSIEEGGRLDVAVGEPTLKGADTVYSLLNSETRGLVMESAGFVPIWKETVDLTFNDVACVQVLEETAQTTATLTCHSDNIPPPTPTLSLRGVHVPKPTLDQILAALGLGQFPANGLTIGVVSDATTGTPLAGQVVTAQAPVGAPAPTVRYLSADRTNANGAATSANGIFISQDAAFGTRFSVGGSALEVGGLVQGKVTVVVIEK